jgi:NAD(P)-dependent dehydrogenase (short-subunit alcohol dehydrogenase family)
MASFKGPILVTGASGGIGGATVRQLRAAEADVIASGRNVEQLKTLAAETGCRSLAFDLTSEGSVRSALEGLDIWGVVNCGGFGGEVATPMETDIAVFDKVISINARGALLVIKYASQSMIRLGKGGSIVNVSSQAALVALRGHISYGSSKAAFVSDLNEPGAKTLASDLGPSALGLSLDVTDQASIDAMVATTVAHFGGVDILVNNAGIFDLAPIVEITRESYRRVYAVNVEGLLFTLQAVAKQMIKQGRGGKIINFASQAGRRGEALVAIYCSSKAAVISLTQSAGLDLIKHHINVNGIAPGVVDNEHWDHVDAMFAKYENLKPGEKKRIVGSSVPFGRMARPDEISGLATFLASEDADYIVAQTYNVDGGNWMS